jgi:hypothetical protein
VLSKVFSFFLTELGLSQFYREISQAKCFRMFAGNEVQWCNTIRKAYVVVTGLSFRKAATERERAGKLSGRSQGPFFAVLELWTSLCWVTSSHWFGFNQ